ncbi:MAG: TetR/AcrR family transcriptional regulator [Eubacteriales bacterium]|nr:TetR/AcrR family transcriptional regulator [Eubacteriales bacterium]
MGTRSDILKAAKEEFLAKGFRTASLRQIAAKSAVTTGAIYGCFENKDALFRAIVEEDLRELRALVESSAEKYLLDDLLRNALENFSDYEQYGKHLVEEQMAFFRYLYDHRESIILLLFQSEGSSLENFLKDFIQVDVDHTILIYKELKQIEKLDIYTKRVLELMVEASTLAFATIFKENEKFEDAKPYLETTTIYYLNSFISYIQLKKE